MVWLETFTYFAFINDLPYIHVAKGSKLKQNKADQK